MNELKVVEKLAEWQRLKALVLESVSSPITRRVYNMALDEFMTWFRQEPRPGFSKATVYAWRVSLQARGLARCIRWMPSLWPERKTLLSPSGRRTVAASVSSRTRS
jgi:hypothetical protein